MNRASSVDEPLRIGVLGASRIAENAIVGPARKLGHRLVVVAARDRRRAEDFAATYGVERVVDTYDEVIAAPDVDMIYNPLANSLHAPWNLAAIRAGKPVLTEKPFARNASEAREVADAARGAGVPILEGFHYLFHPLMARTRELLGDGIIGDLRRVEVVMGMPEPAPTDPRWSYDLAGGSLMDLGCYSVHVFRHLGEFAGGEPVITAASAVVRDGQVDESATIDVRYPSGATGATTTSMVDADYTFRCRIVGDTGELILHDYLSPKRDDRLTIIRDGTEHVEHVSTRATYTFQLEALATALRSGESLPIGPDDAVATMEFIDAAYRAAGLMPR
ncbi:Gfo/Idh/MocA family oxidoreductase [Gordonia sp. VNK1]|uniref:Gfo/Idh/MocA family protein n=1 Tax=Gordonia oleivorans TaxID=3156618 RepID=UPI0032B5187C